MVTIEPPSFCCSITLNASRVTRNTPLARTALFFSQSARLVSAKAGGGGEPRIGHDDVDAAEPLDRLAKRRRDRRLVGDVRLDGVDDIAAEARGETLARLDQGLVVDVGEDDARALRQEPARDGPADSAGAAGHQRHPPGQRLGPGQALQLRLLEQPVLDVERLLLGEADIAVDPGGTAHDVDRVDVELGRDPGRGLVAGEGQHADARHEVDHRVGIAHGRAVGVPATFIVAGIVLAVVLDQPVQGRLVGIGRDHERADLGAQEVVGAGGALGRQLLQPVGVDELEHRRRGIDVTDLAFGGADPPAQPRQKAAHDAPALVLWQRLYPGAAERGRAVVGVQPVLRLLDDPQGRLVAGLAVLGPGEQSVPTQHAADLVRVRARDRLQLQPQLEARPLPGQPADLVAVDLAGQLLRARRSCDRDHRVGVDMVDVPVR